MADLDTTSKRRSGVQVLNPAFVTPPEPTLVLGDIDQGDRQHIALRYSGILAAGAATGAGRPLVNAGLVNRGLVNAGRVN